MATSQNYVTSDVSQMQSLMARISGRDNDVIPTKPGSCITHAFIATDPTARDQEDINIGLISSTLEQYRVILSTDNFTREKTRCWREWEKYKQYLYRGHGKKRGL
jgi:hypothetical protein